MNHWHLIATIIIKHQLSSNEISSSSTSLYREVLRQLSVVLMSFHVDQTTTKWLKLPSLFAAWPFWTFHNKSHNIKALIILHHSCLPFLPLSCLSGNMNFCESQCRLLEYFHEKNSPQITHANHMTMTTTGQI